MSTINDPRIRYHRDAAPMKKMPAVEAAVPNAVKVSADPSTNTSERRNAFRVSLPAVPPTYPITRGTLDTAHGVRDVSTPAAKARNGASHTLFSIKRDMLLRISVISFYF